MDSDTQRAQSGARVLLFAVLLAGAALAIWWVVTRDADGPGGARPGGLGGSRPSVELAYLNLGPEAAYVGSEACKTCHADQHDGHESTPHGRSLRPVEVAAEALPGAFEHEPSGFSYRLEAEDGRVRVREILPLEDGGEEVLNDHDLTYMLGSGEHVQCYLVEVDGFLVQAPIARVGGAWTIAPEYDRPLHRAFASPVDRGCLGCHAGRATNVDQSLHRIRFEEMAIGCERCHGPGSVHVELQERLAANGSATSDAPKAPDLTIVNPARMTREGSLAVCARCHVDEGMTVQRAGRNVLDWRPGLPLSDYRITYRPRTPTGAVPDIGHGEELRASACFQASPDMSCTTCHDAHGRPGAEERAAFYAGKCAECHGPDGCGMDIQVRREVEGGEDCTTCHMPRAEERVPHGVFTNHHIGLHGAEDAPARLVVGEQLDLVLREDLPKRPPPEAERDMALALLSLPLWHPAGKTGDRPLLTQKDVMTAVKRARRGLHNAQSKGALDPDAAAALASLISREFTDKARTLLEGVLEGTAYLREETRAHAMVVLGRSLFELGKMPEAVAVTERLTGLRRSAEDWEFLATMYSQSDNREQLIRAVEQLLAIAPHMESSHYMAAEVFDRLGPKDRAQHHQRLALQLARHLSDARAKEEK